MKKGIGKNVDVSESSKVPLFDNTVSAGFPAFVDEHIEANLDLNKYLIQRPASSFMVRVSGNSMIDDGIFDGDILLVDRSVEVVDNKIVIAVIENELTVKRLKYQNNIPLLVPGNKDYSIIELKDESLIWGVVTAVIRKL